MPFVKTIDHMKEETAMYNQQSSYQQANGNLNARFGGNFAPQQSASSYRGLERTYEPTGYVQSYYQANQANQFGQQNQQNQQNQQQHQQPYQQQQHFGGQTQSASFPQTSSFQSQQPAFQPANYNSHPSLNYGAQPQSQWRESTYSAPSINAQQQNFQSQHQSFSGQPHIPSSGFSSYQSHPFNNNNRNF